MKSPLEVYKKIAEEFNITESKALHTRQKIAFFSEQANQQRMIMNRLMGDLAKARMDLDEAKDDVSKAAYQKKATEYADELRQMSKTADFFIKLEEELSGENPDVKVSSTDIPESN